MVILYTIYEEGMEIILYVKENLKIVGVNEENRRILNKKVSSLVLLPITN